MGMCLWNRSWRNPWNNSIWTFLALTWITLLSSSIFHFESGRSDFFLFLFSFTLRSPGPPALFVCRIISMSSYDRPEQQTKTFSILYAICQSWPVIHQYGIHLSIGGVLTCPISEFRCPSRELSPYENQTGKDGQKEEIWKSSKRLGRERERREGAGRCGNAGIQSEWWMIVKGVLGNW